MTAPVNSAARSALAQVIRAEQSKTLARMALVRLVLAVLVVLAVTLIPPPPGFDTRPSLIGAPIYLVGALIIYFFVVVRKAKGLWSAYAVSLLDIPLVITIQWFQARTAHGAELVVPGNIALMLALTGMSVLSMSKPVVATTWVAAQIGIIVVTLPSVIFVPFLLVSFGLGGLASVCLVMVGRLQQLVVQSREKDLLGKYVLGERLGAGGMAEVFRATYSPEGGFERQVAVKRILPSYADNDEWVALFRREAELGATLAHPNIVQVLDFGSDGSTYFLAMEFIDGMPAGRLLAALRNKNRLLSLNAVVLIASSVADALDYIHGRVGSNGEPLNLVHRDLNPPNLMISRIGEVKLADFGIARSAQSDSNTRSGVVRGKLGYTSPEQLLGRAYDSRADLFSLGVTLYELLTNHRIFHAEGELERMNATLKREIAPPSTVRPEIPPALDAIVMGLIERDVDMRTPSAAVVRQQLGRLDPTLLDLVRARQTLGADVAASIAGNEGLLAAQVSSRNSGALAANEHTQTSLVAKSKG